MSEFYNPYHFVPLDARNKAQQFHEKKRADLTPGNLKGRFRHDLYSDGAHSGRLVVKVHTVTQVAVGGAQQREKGNYTVVRPYEVDGRPAIPASTLRGLIGSVMEASSNGPMRIVEDHVYSYRKPMMPSLSAIGMIVFEKTGMRLMPLALPMLESNDGGATFPVPPRFQRIFPVPQFKVYFGDYDWIRDAVFPYKTHVSGELPVPYEVKQLSYRGNAINWDQSLHVKGGRYVVAQDRALAGTAPARLGYNRILGCSGVRDSSIPEGKTHELWIPAAPPGTPSIPIMRSAVERFEQLADERTLESLGRGAVGEAVQPYHPRGTTRNGMCDECPTHFDQATWSEAFRLKHGDLVYFDVEDKSGKSIVKEIAFSAIWRDRVEHSVPTPTGGRRVEAAGTHAFLRKIDKELLPFSPGRETVSAAEQILGFVEEISNSDDDSVPPAEKPAALAYASRIRFADACLAPDVERDQVLEREESFLRILSSPKLPAPSLYFKTVTPGTDAAPHIPKAKLNPVNHTLQGRKWYLHQRQAEGQRRWETARANREKNKDQKNRVQLIRSNVDFYFHIDFDNLNDTELSLLLYSLSPTPEFHHKLGMGKPLGLGSVKLEVMGLFPVNRMRRYTLAGLRADRYAPASGLQNGMPARYKEETEAPRSETNQIETSRNMMLNSDLVPPNVRQILSLLGDYANAPAAADVSYPLTESQHSPESEHFKWFVSNERPPRNGDPSQNLAPLDRGKRLPKLRKN